MELLLVGVLLLFLGAGAGFAAGLLGIGGGAILVPGLYYIFKLFDYPEYAMHIAVGTSLLTIVFTGTSSAYAHYKKGAVDPSLLKGFLPGVLIGVGAGVLLADIFSSNVLKAVFACSQIVLGAMLFLKRGDVIFLKALPKQPWLSSASAANSCLATLMGVGGGVQNVAFMTLCNVSIHKAIATAAAIGPFIAFFGAVGFLWIGLSVDNLPLFNIGYLNMVAFVCIISTSVLTAPLGARFAHSLPVPVLKRYFAVFMLLVASKMLLELY